MNEKTQTIMFPFFKEHDLSRHFAQFLDSVEARIATSKEYTSSLERQIEALTARLDTLETGTRENAIALREELMVRFGRQLEQLSDHVDTLEATMKRNEGVLSDTQKVTLGFEDRMQRLEELARTHESEMVHVKKDQEKQSERIEENSLECEVKIKTQEIELARVYDELYSNARIIKSITVPILIDAETLQEIELQPFDEIKGRRLFHAPIGKGRKYFAGNNLSVMKVYGYNCSYGGYGAETVPVPWNGQELRYSTVDVCLEIHFMKKHEHHYGNIRQPVGVFHKYFSKGSAINYCRGTDLQQDFGPPFQRKSSSDPSDFAFSQYFLEAA
jgi:hypothetical protein